jgi:hypothetical protein
LTGFHSIKYKALIFDEFVLFKHSNLCLVLTNQLAKAISESISPRSFVGVSITPDHLALAMSLVLIELPVVTAACAPGHGTKP